jgi:hypothetical protein
MALLLEAKSIKFDPVFSGPIKETGGQLKGYFGLILSRTREGT